MAAPNITTQPNAAVNTAGKLLNQLVGRLAQDSGSQSTDMVAAIAAIAAAIAAKPSA